METTTHKLVFPPPIGPTSLDQINEDDRGELALLAEGKNVIIDVGTFLGASAEVFALNSPEGARVFTVDTFEGGYLGPACDLDGLTAFSYAAGRLRDHHGRKVSMMVANSADVARVFAPSVADMVFIDAAHDYENVLIDINLWWPVVKPGGILAGHDYDKIARGISTQEEFNTLVEEHYEEEFHEDSQVHFGVYKALSESFSSIEVSDNRRSSVWWVKKEEDD